MRGAFAGACKKKLGLTLMSDKQLGDERIYQRGLIETPRRAGQSHAALISLARSRRDSTSVNSRQSFSGGMIVPV